MVTPRNSAPVNFGGAAPTTTQSAQIGAAPTDVNKFSRPSQSETSSQRADNSLLDGLLGIITPAVTHLAKVDMQLQQEEAYLRGSASAGANQAEADVESNILTKDWAKAGYRDTRGRLAAADAESQTAVDMKQLRQQPPEKFAEYLATKRDKLLEGFSGMSREARKGMLAQQLVSDRAAIQKHAAEHQAFIIDTITQGVAADVSVKFEAMDAAKVDAPTYGLATANAFTSIYGNVWQNPNLPASVRQKLTSEAMQSALARNHQQLFSMFKNQKVTLPDGSTGTVFSQLPFDEQTKLIKANEASLASTQHIRSVNFDSEMGLMVAAWKDPSQPLMTLPELNAKLSQGIQQGFIGKGDVEKYTNQWADANQRKSAAAGVAQAWQSGDIQALSNMGKTDAEAGQAWLLQQQLSKRPVEQIAGDALAAGIKTGSHSAFKIVGELSKGGIALLGQESVAGVAAGQTLNTILSQVDRAEQEGKSGAMSAMLSSFSDEDRAKVMYFRENLQAGRDPKSAAAMAMQTLLDNAKLGLKGGQIAALQAQNDKDDAKLIAGIEPNQLWGTMSSTVASWFSKDSASRKAIGTGRAWFENEERAEAALVGSKFALMEELGVIGRARPTASASVRQTLALAAVAGRTVMTDSGPLVIPRIPGTNVQQYFGVPTSTMPDTIGAAISEKFKPQPGNRMAFRTAQNELRFEEYNGSGDLVRSGTFDPKSVKDIVAEKDRERTAKYNATDGMGVKKAGTDGYSVTFNGTNTITGLRTEDMLEFRNNLVNYEGVRGAPYDDKTGKPLGVGEKATGKATVGVGIAETNTFYPKVGPDGKISPQALDQSFAQASNAAAEAGYRLAQQYRFTRPDKNSGFLLMSELAYHSGPSFAEKSYYSGFMAAVGKRDKVAALAAFKETPAWAKSSADRRKHYVTLINKSME